MNGQRDAQWRHQMACTIGISCLKSAILTTQNLTMIGSAARQGQPHPAIVTRRPEPRWAASRRVNSGFPDTLEGFFNEINDLHDVKSWQANC
jgi:hypothetical protein